MEDQGFIAGAYERMLRLQRAAPGYPSYQRAAKSKPMEVYTNAKLQMDASEIGLAGSPTVVTDSFVPESTRRAEMLTGTPEELARKLQELIEIEKGKE